MARQAAVALIVVATGVAQWLVGSRSYFALDDFWQLRVAQQKGLTLHYLIEPIFQHFGPGDRFIFWVIVRFFPLKFGAALGLMLVFFVGSVLLFQACLDLLFGRRWVTLTLTFLFASSLFWVPQFDWLASGAHQVPATFFTLAAFYCYLRYAYDSRRLWIALSAIAMCAALLFFIKPLLLLIYLLGLRFLFLGDDGDVRPRAAVRVLRREAFVWLTYIFFVLAYLAGYFKRYYVPSPGHYTARQVLDLIQLSWLRTLVPGTLGFRPVETLDARGLTLVLVAQALVVALIVASLIRWRGAWRAWVFLGVVFLANIVLSGVPRLGQFGVGVSYELRYFLDMSWLLPLSVGLAFLPFRKAEAREVERLPRRSLSFRAPVAATAVVLVALYSAVGWHSANRTLDLWPGATVDKPYFQHLSAGLDVLERRVRVPNLVDFSVPEAMIGSWIAPFNRASNVFASLGRPLEFDDYTRPLWVADDSGYLHRAVFQEIAGGAAADLVNKGLIEGRDASFDGSSFCVSPGQSGALIFTPNPPISGPRYFLQLRTTGSGSMGEALNQPPDASGEGTPMAPIGKSGLSTWALDTQALTRLMLIVKADSRFCISSIAVGYFVPTGPPVGAK